ncbi:hypothetical protein DPMN_154868 [Dreissena polymorpha]|uniref:HEPN domain-containing protein n=2 Tax=Dreissena polymorpha TaxID=45954 RepID=A0A9D4FQT2_DREPO|nr:hypothetical protein DPMN_154868 [Dreissena polymorpha]
MMLAFAKRIAHEGSLQMTQDLIASSNVLVEYLLGPAGKKFGDKTYSEISRVEFVVSYTVSSELATICQPYSSSEAFICFEESCDSQFEDICWTSVPLLLNMPKKTKYCKLLGIKQEPDVDSVIRHCQNICDILKKDFEKKHSNINNKQQIMENIYKFLLKKQDKINPSRLIETPIILIPNETMVKASLVILRQSVGQEIKPYLYQAPEIYRHCFDLFKKMGATAEASCWQYANVLSTIKKHFMENELHDGALEKASIAIKHMFAILSIAQDKSTQFDGVNVLYLPNCKRVLTKSNELTVCDNDGFRKKLEIPCQLNFFIGFQQLEIDLKDPVEPFMNLPKNLQPRVLSQDVTEIVSTDDMQEDDNNEDALSYERLFYSQAFHEGLCRLLRHQNGKNNTIIWKEEDDTHLKSTLSKVRIKAVTGLKTLLVFKGELIPGVSIEKPYYVDEVRDDDTSLVGDNTGLAFHLYYQRGETHRVHLFNRASIQSAGLWQLVERCTRGLLEKEESYLVHSLLNLRNNPEYISECLDEHQIRAYGTVDELSVFPQPGSYVEEKFFPFLVQQIQPIPEHSYRFVALEIGNDDEDDETRQPTFIYAHVHRKVSTTNTSVLSINYEVDSGIGVQYAGRSVVPIFRLYLFLPQKQDTTTDIEVFDTEPVTSMPFNETCERIMSMLQEAFEHLSLQDRKRIIRRLIMKWHPDKNLGNEEYTTRVLNFIRHCIVRLERGENLIMNVEPSAPDMRASTYWNTCAAAYNTGQVFAACYNNNVDDYRSHRSFSHRQTHRDPVCSPGEFKRWIKQAKLDFLTGQAHLNCTEKHPETYNWICYICHQACEKALKAAWFLKDANRCPIREHSLVDIANGLDQNIADEAHSFEQQLRIRGCYAKLRYPDSVNSCQVPSDVFSKDEAEFAVTTAKSIMEMVDALSG